MLNPFIFTQTTNTLSRQSKTVCSRLQTPLKAFITLVVVAGSILPLSSRQSAVANETDKRLVCSDPDVVALYEAVDAVNTRASIGLTYFELRHYHTELEILRRKLGRDTDCLSARMNLETAVFSYNIARLLLEGHAIGTGFISTSGSLVTGLRPEIVKHLPVSTRYGQSFVSSADLADAYLADANRVFKTIPEHTRMVLK